MTDMELRSKVAELAGWKNIRTLTREDLYSDENLYGWVGSPGGIPPWYLGTNPEYNMEALPDYLNDLNAMNAVEKTLVGEQAFLYVDLLTATMSGVWADHKRRLECATATARQRAEAFVKTMEES